MTPAEQPRTFTFEELTVWRTELPDAKFAVLPPGNTRPNPLIAGDKLFVSVFSLGAVCALERDTGRIIWRRELPKLKCPHTLYALRTESGETLW
jgi:hypothetical protein